MKKLGLICLLTVVFLSPSLVSAQVVTQEEVNAQLLVLINQLMTQVQQLMTKLIAMQTKQLEDSQTLGAVQTQVNTFVQPVASSPTPAPKPLGQIITEKLDALFSERKNICRDLFWNPLKSQEVRDWKDNATTAQGAAYQWVIDHTDPLLRDNLMTQIPEVIQNPSYPQPSLSSVPFTKFVCNRNDEEAKAGCQKAVEIMNPYIACMMGQ